MGRPTGIAKTGGRKKGTPNRASVALSETISDCLGKTIPEAILERLNRITPSEQVRTLMGLMEYVYPKRRATDHQELPRQEEKANIHLVPDRDLIERFQQLTDKMEGRQ